MTTREGERHPVIWNARVGHPKRRKTKKQMPRRWGPGDDSAWQESWQDAGATKNEKQIPRAAALVMTASGLSRFVATLGMTAILNDRRLCRDDLVMTAGRLCPRRRKAMA